MLRQLTDSCSSFLYGFHHHLKQGPLDFYLKNETQETDVEGSVVRNCLRTQIRLHSHHRQKKASLKS